MAFCTECGKELKRPGEKYCTECGAAVSARAGAKAATEKGPESPTWAYVTAHWKKIILVAFVAWFFFALAVTMVYLGAGGSFGKSETELVVAVTDAPGDLVTKFNITSVEITFSRVSVLGDSGWRDVFTGEKTIELLRANNLDVLLTQGKVVPSAYNGARLTVKEIAVTQNGEQKIISLQNNVLEFNGLGVKAAAGETKVLEFDFKMEDSVFLEGGKLSVRPKVIVTSLADARVKTLQRGSVVEVEVEDATVEARQEHDMGADGKMAGKPVALGRSQDQISILIDNGITRVQLERNGRKQSFSINSDEKEAIVGEVSKRSGLTKEQAEKIYDEGTRWVPPALRMAAPPEPPVEIRTVEDRGLTPAAGGLTGRWNGNFRLNAEIMSPDPTAPAWAGGTGRQTYSPFLCEYVGAVTAQVEQKGDRIYATGSFQNVRIASADPDHKCGISAENALFAPGFWLVGRVSSSSLELFEPVQTETLPDDLFAMEADESRKMVTGSFTSDLITLYFTGCDFTPQYTFNQDCKLGGQPGSSNVKLSRAMGSSSSDIITTVEP